MSMGFEKNFLKSSRVSWVLSPLFLGNLCSKKFPKPLISTFESKSLALSQNYTFLRVLSHIYTLLSWLSPSPSLLLCKISPPLPLYILLLCQKFRKISNKEDPLEGSWAIVLADVESLLCPENLKGDFAKLHMGLFAE